MVDHIHFLHAEMPLWGSYRAPLPLELCLDSHLGILGEPLVKVTMGPDMDHHEAKAWIVREDSAALLDRIARLDWLAANCPVSEFGFMVEGGWVSLRLLEEAKYCFVYGQFLASAILGVAFIERVIAARFFAAGRDDLERASGFDLLREALRTGWMSPDEFEQFDTVRRLRNPIVHFRRSLAPDTIEHRAVRGDTHPEVLVENDAKEILIGALHVLRGSAV